jgi:sugar O-acyltransferase (sialic acid O-acetyltransferase NeuD family)
MKNLVIIGAGGYGREVLNLAIHCNEINNNLNIKGFIDDNISALDNFQGYPPILSSIKDYKIENDDVFVCGIGNIQLKKELCSHILQLGGNFITLIHPSSRINQNSKIGNGVLVFMNSNISNDCIIDDFVTIQGYVGLGHDTIIGKWSHINTYTFTGGAVIIGDEVLLNTRSTILPKVKICSNAVVGACSLVVSNIKEPITVFGIPAKKLTF